MNHSCPRNTNPPQSVFPYATPRLLSKILRASNDIINTFSYPIAHTRLRNRNNRPPPRAGKCFPNKKRVRRRFSTLPSSKHPHSFSESTPSVLQPRKLLPLRLPPYARRRNYGDDTSSNACKTVSLTVGGRLRTVIVVCLVNDSGGRPRWRELPLRQLELDCRYRESARRRHYGSMNSPSLRSYRFVEDSTRFGGGIHARLRIIVPWMWSIRWVSILLHGVDSYYINGSLDSFS
jgi:hypothetical protein